MRIFIHVFSRAFRILILSLSLQKRERRETRDERERDVAPPSSPPKTAIHEIYSVVKSIFFLLRRERRERERERERESAKNTYRAYLVSPPQPDLSPLPADECHEVHSGEETQTHDDYFATNHRSMKEENERRREKERKKREEERREEKH